MYDPCDNCNKPCCYGCQYADNDAIAEERKKEILDNAHKAEQIVWWLSYQGEMTESEQRELVRMTNFLRTLRERMQ